MPTLRGRAADALHRQGTHVETQLLLLDEPSMGLAPVLVQEIYREIEEIRKHTTILLVEQNAYQALKTADRGYVLETGRIVMEALPGANQDPEVKKAYLGK